MIAAPLTFSASGNRYCDGNLTKAMIANRDICRRCCKNPRCTGCALSDIGLRRGSGRLKLYLDGSDAFTVKYNLGHHPAWKRLVVPPVSGDTPGDTIVFQKPSGEFIGRGHGVQRTLLKNVVENDTAEWVTQEDMGISDSLGRRFDMRVYGAILYDESGKVSAYLAEACVVRYSMPGTFLTNFLANKDIPGYSQDTNLNIFIGKDPMPSTKASEDDFEDDFENVFEDVGDITWTYHLVREFLREAIKVVKPVPEEKGFIMLGVDILPGPKLILEVNDSPLIPYGTPGSRDKYGTLGKLLWDSFLNDVLRFQGSSDLWKRVV